MYKFDPTKHGFEPISNFPELSYAFPLTEGIWYVKVIVYTMLQEKPVYWYLALSTKVGLNDDDRIKIVSGSHDSRRPKKYYEQNNTRVVFTGLISSDEFAKELLIHLLGTTKNESVLNEGKQRYETNLKTQLLID